LPHSEIPGSKPVCGSPRLIAACHVLRRLLAPRHSPYALSSLTIRKGTHADRGRRPGAGSPRGLDPLSRLRQSLLAHCVCCGRKLPFAGYSVVKDHPGDFVPRKTLRRRSRGPFELPSAPAGALTRSRAWRASFARRQSRSRPTPGSLTVSTGRRLVENTGLEPVTSWLQTRRSPS
jgi:hypothetical protein